MTTPSAWASMYLKRIGMDVEAPGLDYLQRLVRSRSTRLAFENISKLHYLKAYEVQQYYLPPAEVYLDHMYRFDYSGVCHTGNYYFCRLLQELGYDAYPIKYASHLAIIVKLEDRLYYTDVSLGHPAYYPMDISRPHEITIHQSQIKGYPDPGNKLKFHLVHGISGKEQHHWVFRPYERAGLPEVHQLIHWSNEPQRLFTTILRVYLWQPDRQRSLSLLNNTFTIRYQEGQEQMKLHSIQEIQDIVHHEFGMAKLPVSEAAGILESLGTPIWGE
ncbi:arylamine N-acetyltransferase [Paenibacillus piscarius]|uniref:arylamine N-acetyltransferase n=1 Tax=Paenibacillus piscarius TaxID=1089681 RepID=UPI001EE94C22|nr:arylamine N-acetyltransferase [Paenibacillus piscarius]